jgi:FemAB-related protein (PEP-CTERM system-associated)
MSQQLLETSQQVSGEIDRVASVLDHTIEVTELRQGEEDEWDRFVLNAPSGTFFHLYAWKTIIEAVLGRRCVYFVAKRANKITGVFPVCLTRSRLFGDCLVSLPLAVYGGICAQDRNSYFALLEAATRLAKRQDVKYIEMRNRYEPFLTSLPGRSLYVTFTQDLSPGSDTLMQGLPRDTRYMIRKSQKAGLEWVDNLSVNEFYDLYARNVHRLGTPVFSKQLFHCLLSEFSNRCKIFGVRKGKKAIAGVLCFYFNMEVIPYYSGSLTEYYKDCPNNFMYWSLMAQSCQEGYRSFDFGRSKRGTGACQFKSSWNMRVTELPYRYKLLRANDVPHISPVDGKFRAAVALWKRLPYSLATAIGPRLVKSIPSI